MKKLSIFALVTMFAFAGCTKDTPVNPDTPIEPGTKSVTVTATVEQQEDETRTSLKAGNVLWTAFDQIQMILAFNSSIANRAVYTLKTGAEQRSGTFSGIELAAGPKWAVYPNERFDAVSKTGIDINLPTTQKYVVGSFGNGVNPMIAKSDEAGKNLSFHNLCGAIRLKLAGDHVIVKQITVTSVGEKISGRGTVAMNYTVAPQLEMNPDAYNYVSLTEVNETLDPVKAKEFIIVLPSGNYAAGMVFAIKIGNGDIVYATTKKELTIERSKVTPLAQFELVPLVKHFPDYEFRAYLKTQGLVLSNEGEANEDIDPTNPTNQAKFTGETAIQIIRSGTNGIISLKGIEHFTDLTKLYCSGNDITMLDLSRNTKLDRLACDDNKLTSLDVTANTELVVLNCNNNQLTSLDVTANTGLTSLSCDNNQLTSLNVTANTGLTSLKCYNNQLTSLDVTANTGLTTLECYSNQLTMINLRNNTRDIPNLMTGDQVAANNKLLDITVYISPVQTTELEISNNKRVKLVDSDPPI